MRRVWATKAIAYGNQKALVWSQAHRHDRTVVIGYDGQLQGGPMSVDPRSQSRILVDGPDRAAARAMLKAVGFTDEDLTKPLVGVAHCWIGITPCNYNHRTLAEKV